MTHNSLFETNQLLRWLIIRNSTHAFTFQVARESNAKKNKKIEGLNPFSLS